MGVNDPFLSTPSARRATGPVRVGDLSDIISIHALREEGDLQTQALSEVPRGFLSTPSARRATTGLQLCDRAADDFYPRPPRGGRLIVLTGIRHHKFISIHALREEGDVFLTVI